MSARTTSLIPPPPSPALVPAPSLRERRSRLAIVLALLSGSAALVIAVLGILVLAP